MLARLGHVLYVTAILMVLGLWGSGVFLAITEGFSGPVAAFFGGAGVVMLLIGRAMMYVLAGE